MPSLRDLFAHHHRLSDDERRTLLSECIYVLDTNVLLNLYRYAAATREDLLRVLGALPGRLWVPYQVATEFYRNRIDVIREQRAKYDELTAQLERLLTSATDSAFKRSGFLRIEEITAILTPAVTQAKDLLSADRDNHPDLLKHDPYLDKLVAIIGSSVGAPPTPDDFDKRCQDAQARLDRKQPPGYRDTNKPAPDKYGDVLIWFEMLAFAVVAKKPLALVTDDDKDDWWHIVGGEKQGARPELRLEMRTRSGQDFFLCKPAFLLETIGGTLPTRVSESSIDDAKRLAADLKTQSGNLGHHQDDSADKFSSFQSMTSEARREQDRVARHAVGMWLTSEYPRANILQSTHGSDYVVATDEWRIGVTVKTLSHLGIFNLRTRFRDIALRNYYELNEGRLSRSLLVLVARTSGGAFEAIEALISKVYSGPALHVVVGYLTSSLTFERVWDGSIGDQ